MTPEEVRFFNLVQNYAGPKYPYRLLDITFIPQSGMYHLRFQGGSNDARVLTVFKERFEDAVAQNALSSELVRDIDDALGSN
ncbi:MAG: hypothetical protein LAP85_14875 [Acidobacteriia bacterium]|nr:hypothetical protein [Terriglobia bacterium]